MTIQDIFAIRINHGYILQIFLAEVIFFPLLERRDHFILRLFLSFIIFVFLSLILTNVVEYYLPGFNSFIIFLLSIGIGIVCFKSRFSEILYCFIAAQLLQNLSHNIEFIFYLPFKENFNDLSWFFLSVGVMLLVYIMAHLTMIRRFRSRRFNLQNYGVLIISVISSVFCYLIQYAFQVFELDEMWVIYLPLILCDALLLILLFGLQSYKWKIDENAQLESFIAKEDERYRSLTESIDMINMKAHDLKHFITDLRSGGDLDDSDLADMQEAIERYEDDTSTGYKPLDAVLTEKRYICSQNHISFSLFVDGKSLSFMKASDIVSIFGNLVGNAVEYELKVEDIEKRYIILKALRRGDLISIHVENYCAEKIRFSGDLPVSTKDDPDFHGYGLKSVRYIVNRYHGHLTFDDTDSAFCVDAVIPVPSDRDKEDH